MGGAWKEIGCGVGVEIGGGVEDESESGVKDERKGNDDRIGGVMEGK